MLLGIALSGGGIRGIAHAGVLKALDENNIKVDIIGGTSSGSLVSVLYAMGYSPYYIFLLFKRYAKSIINFDALPIINTIGNFMANKRFHVCGFNSGTEIQRVYDEIARNKKINDISDIKMPIVIPSVDINDSKKYIFTNRPLKNTNRTRYISNISVGTAVRASSSFPGIFCPCEFNNHKFLDGGILDNIPVKEVRKQGADKVIAVNFRADVIDENSNFMDISMRTLDIMGNKISEENLADSDYVLTVETDKTGLLDVDKLESCYKSGYDFCIRNIEKIKTILY